MSPVQVAHKLSNRRIRVRTYGGVGGRPPIKGASYPILLWLNVRFRSDVHQQATAALLQAKVAEVHFFSSIGHSDVPIQTDFIKTGIESLKEVLLFGEGRRTSIFGLFQPAIEHDIEVVWKDRWNFPHKDGVSFTRLSGDEPQERHDDLLLIGCVF